MLQIFMSEKFSDRWHPDFYKIQRNDVTVDEIMEVIIAMLVKREEKVSK